MVLLGDMLACVNDSYGGVIIIKYQFSWHAAKYSFLFFFKLCVYDENEYVSLSVMASKFKELKYVSVRSVWIHLAFIYIVSKKNCTNLFFAPCLSNMTDFNKNWKDCARRNT